LSGTEAFDFLSFIYDCSTPQSRSESKYSYYIHKYTNSRTGDVPQLKIVRSDLASIIPSKKRASDVGFDLTVIKKTKDLGNKSALYDTGIIVQPPVGYYIEIVPRSSLSKSGYIQTNSVGIIDPNYLDTLKVPLTKIDESAPDLTFPFTGSQLILRKQNHGIIHECDMQDLLTTSRNTGGFGSTGALNQHQSTTK